MIEETLPRVSVVVISYNGADVIRECLSSVLASDYPNLEVVLVNNGSTDDLPQIAKREYPEVRLIELYPNRGYAGGMNEGLKVARGEILIPLNDDTEITPNLITEMVRPFLHLKNVGIVGCKILYPDRKTIQHAGGIILPSGHTRHIGYLEEDQGQYEELREVDYVTGCAIAIPRKIFEQLGLYDDRYYPTYFEEVEYAVRVRKAGYKVIYAPKAVLYHKESKTEIKYSPQFLYRYSKSRLRFILKNFELRQIPAALFYELQWFAKIDWKEYFIPLTKAYFSTLLRLPVILYDRYYRFLPLAPLEDRDHTESNRPHPQ